MSALRALAGIVSALCGWLAVACLAAACIVVCQMVVVRYWLEASTIWQTEFVLYAVVAATLLGSPEVLARGGHVAVDLLGTRLAPGPRRWQQALAATMGLVFCLVLALSGGRYFLEAWREGWVTESVWAPPLWAVLLPLPLGLGALVLQYLAQLAGRGRPPAREPDEDGSA